jgi:hypothetical protein
MVPDYEIETEFQEEGGTVDEPANESFFHLSFANSEDGDVLADEVDLLRFNSDESALAAE